MSKLTTLKNDKNISKKVRFVITFIGSLWVIHIINFIIGNSLNQYGISPGFFGLIGIFTAPFLHGGFIHLISNSLPLFFLSLSAMMLYGKIAKKAIIIIIILGGFLTWIAVEIQYLLFNNIEIHIGASGLVFGLMAFLLSCGLFIRNTKSIIVSFVVFIGYGGTMIIGFLPRSGISWEGHLFGAIAGVVSAFVLRKQLK